MGIVEIIVTAFALAMDAFAASVCKGLAAKELRAGHCVTAGLWFGGFQALMPFLGWLIGSRFVSYAAAADHWIAFVLLAAVGANMIREALGKDEKKLDAKFSVGAMFPLAVATSIDALAVGVGFSCTEITFLPPGTAEIYSVLAASALIGVVTFGVSAAGVGVGHAFGARFKTKAEIAGGVILILLGLKILLSDLGVLPF